MSNFPQTFSVGGLRAELLGQAQPWRFFPSDPTVRFLSTEPGDLKIDLSRRDPHEFPAPETDQPFSYGWRIVEDPKNLWIEILDKEGVPLKTLQVNRDWKRATLFLNQKIDVLSSLFPLEIPMGEVLFYQWAPWREGLVVHGATLLWQGKAITLMGYSGAGKSTLSALWAKRYGDQAVLTDERTLIQKNGEGQWWAYGTPWQGSGAFALPKGAPLLCFGSLEKSPTNSFSPVSRATRTTFLLRHMLLPQRESGIISQVMKLAEDIGKETPGGTYAFSPTPQATDDLAQALSQLS